MSDNAVSMITNTIKRLQDINIYLQDEKGDIVQYQAGLNDTLESIDTQYKTNAKLITKFKSFLED